MEPNFANPTPSTPTNNPIPDVGSTNIAPPPLQSNPTLAPTPNSDFDNSFLHAAPVHKSFLAQHARLILFVGLGVSVVLTIVGIFVHINYDAKDTQGRNVTALQQEITALDSEIAKLAATDNSVFQNSGFSSSFYQASNNRTELELQRTDLQHTLDTISATNASANIFNTGAVYLFLAAMVCAFIAITLFLTARRRPRSNSIIAS